MRKAWLVATLALISLWVVAWIQTAHSDALSTELLRRSTPAGITVEEPDMASVTIPSWGWKDENGVCQIMGPVVVTQQQGESLPDFAARVRATRNALYAEFPQDPSCPQNPPLPQD